MSDEINKIFEAAKKGELNDHDGTECTYIKFYVPVILTKEIFDEIWYECWDCGEGYHIDPDETLSRKNALLAKYNLTEEKECG